MQRRATHKRLADAADTMLLLWTSDWSTEHDALCLMGLTQLPCRMIMIIMITIIIIIIIVIAHLQDDDSKRWDYYNSLHLGNGPPEGHAMLMLFQNWLVVLGVAWVMCKEVVEDAQGKADDSHCQEHHPPPLNAKGGVPTCMHAHAVSACIWNVTAKTV